MEDTQLAFCVVNTAGNRGCKHRLEQCVLGNENTVFNSKSETHTLATAGHVHMET